MIIAHRGNLTGPSPEKENSPEYIDMAISAGYPVEVDLRSKDAELWLGHDVPQYQITQEWLYARKENLWIHIKDYYTAILMSQLKEGYQFFCHQSDDFTITSTGHVWLHDLKNEITKECIIPLIDKDSIIDFAQKEFFAICTDYVYICEENIK
jgi:hypothetical protein